MICRNFGTFTALHIAPGMDEVVYTIRADIRHGQLSRDPKDWEC